jgi:predicted permease
MESLLYDIRYGARSLWKSKGLSFIAAISLAVGIGANSAIFSLVNSLLLRPRAVSAPEQLVGLYKSNRGTPYEGVSYPSYLDFRERNEVFTGLAGYSIGWQFRLGVAGDVDQVWGEVVTGNLFDVLGVRPDLGRTFLAEEDQVAGRNPVVIIGHSLWQRRFASDSALIGKTISLNNHPMTVVGVLPPKFNGMTSGWASEIWVPVMTTPLVDPSNGTSMVSSRGSSWLVMVGRLKPGTTLEQARARFALLTKEMQREQPREWMRGNGDEVRESYVSVLPERDTRVHPAMRPVGFALAALLFVIVDLVLLIACMNLASLLFARSVSRRSEMAIRMALGAGRLRIVRQLLAESVLLSVVAGAAGAVLSLWSLSALVALMPSLPEGIRLAVNLQVDWRVVAFAVAFSTITGVLFGLAPALQSSRTAVSGVLKEESSASTGRFRKSRLRTSLVVGQVAFSLLLLISAGLVLRSLDKLRPTRLGFSSDNFVSASLSLDESRYDRTTSQRFFRQVSENVAALPGVQSVSLVEGMPGGFMSRSRSSTEIEGYTPGPDEDMEIDANIVSPRYFTNMNVPFLSGRDFGIQDVEGSPCVSIVNEAFSQRYLGGPGQALGKNLVRYGDSPSDRTTCRIVGVVRDNAWQSLQRDVRPFFFMPLLQSNARQMTLLAQTAGSPGPLVPGVREAIKQLDAGMPLSGVQTIRQAFNSTTLPFRMLGFVMTACGVLALLLASVGIYGTLAYSVAQRKREVGIRMALGALRRDILGLIVGQGMVLVGIGLGIGLLLGLALTRVLTILPGMELLFGVSATDLLTFVAVTVLLGLVALLACYVPARRATRTDPMVTLRNS